MSPWKKRWRTAFWASLASLSVLCVNCEARSPSPAPNLASEMIVIPAGWFWMGSDDGPEASRPHHQVYLDSYAIDRSEVANAAYAEFIARFGVQPKVGWPNELAQEDLAKPVVGILWREAEAYCRWAGKRLPTEAEWEKAARGTDGRRFPWGNEWNPANANTLESARDGAAPIGSHPDGASPYGAIDMAGNAAEWVADFFDYTSYEGAPDRNPTGPTAVMDHGLRGGSWDSPEWQVQTFFRDSSHSAVPNLRVGFRCARDAPGEP